MFISSTANPRGKNHHLSALSGTPSKTQIYCNVFVYNVHYTKINMYFNFLSLSPLPQETESRWLSYSSDQPVSIVKEVFPMTIKGIARSCLGDVFDSHEELNKLTESYHKCWLEMEVS